LANSRDAAYRSSVILAVVSLTIEPETRTDAPPTEPQARSHSPRSETQPSAAAMTRRLCPYLEIEGGAWRSATPDRDHRCGAVTPVALLSIEKQRRLCLTERHTACATYLAARGLDGASDGEVPPLVAVGPGRPVSPEAVTRWAIVRTTPVVLDHARVPLVGAITPNRMLGQVGLAVLLVAAFAAIVIGRLSGGSSAGLVGALPSASSAAILPGPAGTPAPSFATPAPETPSPKPTGTSTPAPSPSPSASSSPTTATTYKVHQGDTLYAIAVRFHTSVGAIKRLNHLTTITLHIGQVLKIPQVSG
jgi:LysM repeat protein